MCVNYENVNNGMIAQDCSRIEFHANRVTLGIEL